MSILVPGDTCWRLSHADRAAFLIDTQAYFAAVYAALAKAQHSVILLGWGFDPRTRLKPDGHDGPDDPDEVGRILLALTRERPHLDVRLLIWRSALAIAASQDFFPYRAAGWFKDTPVKFRLDDALPFGACHHQKVLVIDDAVAFCGGGDISVDRWDTTAHRDVDPRRMMPDHECHAPRHEVVMMVDGEAARSLGDLARERWKSACGEVIAPPPVADTDPWPGQVAASLSNVMVGIARTEPAQPNCPTVEEIRRLTQSSIVAARETIYLENQYFTSPLIVEALAGRLSEPEGPEVVLISTGDSPSWFDRLTMDRARSNMLQRLRAADVHNRFRAFYPTTPKGAKIIVHAKSSVFDDKLARVGSANLNNRSGGFDTECELAVEGTSETARAAITAFRDRSIGHFLGYAGETVAEARAEFGGLAAAVDKLNHRGRLFPIEPMALSAAGEFIAGHHLGDPLSVADSWRLGHRRERLYAEARALGVRGLFKSRDWTAPFFLSRESN